MALNERMREARIEWQEELRPSLIQASMKAAREELNTEREGIIAEAKEKAKREIE